MVIEEKIWQDGKKEVTLETTGFVTKEWGQSTQNSEIAAAGTVNYTLKFVDFEQAQQIKFNYNKGQIISLNATVYPTSDGGGRGNPGGKCAGA